MASRKGRFYIHGDIMRITRVRISAKEGEEKEEEEEEMKSKRKRTWNLNVVPENK